jgi:hypothetical protein
MPSKDVPLIKPKEVIILSIIDYYLIINMYIEINYL